jgi:hypothetical protein
VKEDAVVSSVASSIAYVLVGAGFIAGGLNELGYLWLGMGVGRIGQMFIAGEFDKS